MDMTLTSASYPPSAFGLMGVGRPAAQDDIAQLKSTVLDEVVEVVQAGYDLSREVTQSRSENRSEEKSDDRSEESWPGGAADSEAIAAKDGADAPLVAPATFQSPDKGRAVDLIA